MITVMNMTGRWNLVATGTALALGLTLSACAYRPGDEDSPLRRSFTWFSYLNADDIRASCRSSAANRYRIVYNGVWQEQLRTYDITAVGGGARLEVKVTGDVDFARPIPLDDLLSPWRGRTERSSLSARDIARLRGALRQSGFYEPVPQGLRVRSWGFFWVVAACEDGRFHFNAWAYPSPRFARVRLRRVLESWDKTGIPFARPRETWEPDREEHKDIDRYQLVVRGDRFSR